MNEKLKKQIEDTEVLLINPTIHRTSQGVLEIERMETDY